MNALEIIIVNSEIDVHLVWMFCFSRSNIWSANDDPIGELNLEINQKLILIGPPAGFQTVSVQTALKASVQLHLY